MKHFFLQKTKNKITNQEFEAVIVTTKDNYHPYEVMANEELLDSKEISEKEAIDMCGEEAVKLWTTKN